MTKEERTPLVDFEWSAARRRQRRLRRFQCCTGALLVGTLVAITVALVGTWGTSNVGTAEERDAWREATDAGSEALRARDDVERVLLARSAQYAIPGELRRHQSATHTSQTATSLARHGFAKDRASRHFGHKKYNDSNPMPEICNTSLSAIISTEKWSPTYNCTRTEDAGHYSVISCDATERYRSIDGTCNNLDNPTWGSAFSSFRRSIPPVYQDGVGEPRSRGVSGALPPALQVSEKIHRPLYRKDPQFTVMLAVWGQFLDHDITATALSRAKDNIPIQCCTGNDHPECFPVLDTRGINTTLCMEFVRSAPAPSCCLGTREQMNQATSYIDGSMIYGSEEELARKLRSHHSGLLTMLTTQDGRDLLPASHDPNDGCNRATMNHQGKYCFLSGDARSNENLHLTSIHLILARHHNNIAGGLAKINAHWSDDKIYNETRHIIASQIQHITYTEFLPVIVGEKVMKKYHLEIGNYSGYNDSLDATIANEFASAVFRFAHTLIPGLMRVLANDTSSEEYIELHKMLFNPYSLYQPGQLNSALQSAMATNIDAADTYFSEQLKNNLFRGENDTFRKSACGIDLVSLNIQRGRDHGLAGYPKWREYCGLEKPRHFQDLLSYIDGDSVDRMSVLYPSVEDVDLYTGALSERPLEGSLLGPTATCLIVEQFVRLKYGDRFWYERSEGPQAFTQDQLMEIKKTSLAAVICANADSLDKITLEVMRRESVENVNIPCENTYKLDYSKWRED